MESFFHTLIHAVQITFFIISMMVLIDFINVISKGNWTEKLKTNLFIQNFIGAFLGALPGCLGPFTISSMYFHNLVRFGAITATMIATSGDESFVMLALFPKTALLLMGILFVIGLFSGIIIDLVLKMKKIENCCSHSFKVHENEEEHTHFSVKNLKLLLKKPLFPRLLISSVIFCFILFYTFNLHRSDFQVKKLIFLIISVLFFIITIFSDTHFIEDHIYKHIIKTHLVRLLTWTGASLLAIEILLKFPLGENFFKSTYLMILIASLTGLIPESGPHLFFVTLFAQGMIPFSVLLASSISQDGHGSLPLLSQSKKDFFIIKSINLVIGLLAGYLVLFIGH
ncbi:MAG: putative manganese transporter [Myxococcota bacterium]